ncbi:MAG TPA: rhombosortase, partial [Rubrivivax sp.]|nr:rhombosortase [Rubrivivax sp.]
MTPGDRAWPLLAGALAAASLLAWWWPAAAMDWQPVLAASQPWRAWTAAFVHWSALHLAANLAGAAVVGALGLVARLPWQMALTWFLAWPLTQLSLLLRPELAHYGGLSGVLHAGVAVIALWLLFRETGRRRLIGWAVAAGLLTKIVLEAPWGPVLREASGWDIKIAPLAHAGGALAGAVCAALLLWLRPSRV